jgi:SAM-dependent methyltransferase
MSNSSCDNYDIELVCKEISPNERMVADTLAAYLSVGRSTIDLLRFLWLTKRERKQPSRILDFGCGHGRVARHLRVWAPDSTIFAADVRTDAIEFCASVLGCVPVQLTPTFGEAILPGEIDLVWVGSVFTHIDHSRMRVLFEWLWRSVSPGGYLMITTHGEHAKRIVESGKMRFIAPEKWKSILDQYRSSGCGYESYGREDLGDWGVSLISIENAVELSSPFHDAMFVMMVSGGWANLQDVVVWQKM